MKLKSINIDADRHREVAHLAIDKGVPIVAIIHQAIDDLLAQEKRNEKKNI